MTISNEKISKYIPLLLLPIALFLCLGLWWMSIRYSQTFVESDTAVFDLRGEDFSNQFFEVDSTVEYVADVFLTPQEFEQRDDIRVGSVPKTEKAVTMRIRILVPDDRQYGICGYPVNYASSVYVNGKWLFDEGKPSLTAEAELARESFRLFSAEPVNGVIEILVQTSSFSVSTPSSGMEWTIGDYEKVRLYHFHRTLTDLTVVAWYVIIAFLSLLLFLSLPDYKANGWLTLLALVWGLRSGLTGTRPLFTLLPDLEWQLANTLEKLTTPVTLILITLILHSAFPDALPRWLRRISLGIAGIGTFMYIVLPLSFFFGTTKYVNLIMFSVLAVQFLFLLFSARRKPVAFPQKIILAGLVIILIAFLWDSAYFGPLLKKLLIFSLTQPLMVTFSLFMVTASVLDTIRQSTEREVRLIEHVELQERELLESRIDVMLSQIQPHFLYNTLTAIGNLCRNDGEEAAKLVNYFSNYLRNNMDALTQKEPVTFDRELEHIKVYLDIEKVRFDKRLNVVYDLKVTDFFLPILTIQPLVENAVRHGITKKLEGGTVTISTQSLPEGVEITVSDDGAGFNLSKLSIHNEQSVEKGQSHVGLENVNYRLAAQCKGELTVQSEIGKGTICTVFIPHNNSEQKESGL